MNHHYTAGDIFGGIAFSCVITLASFALFGGF